MLVLAMDTSTSQVGVALGTEEGVLAQVALVGSRRHAEQLAPALEYVLAQAGVGLTDVELVATGVGPGLFTGLRVGMTTAKMLAATLDVPAVGASSLDLVAAPVRMAPGRVVAVTDARRGEVYAAVYDTSGGRFEKVVPDRVVPPQTLADDLAALDDPVLLAGAGARIHADSLAVRPGIEVAPVLFDHPSPAALVELALANHASGECVSARELQPVYLRKSDAEMQWSGGSG